MFLTEEERWLRYQLYGSLDVDSKVYGANMGTIRSRQDPDGPHVGPTSLAVWEP